MTVWPLASLLVLPIGWLELRLLPRTRWASLLAVANLVVLYGPWTIAARESAPSNRSAPLGLVGAGMLAIGVGLWIAAVPLVLRVPGQLRALPEALVTRGPFRSIRHPLYAGHVLVIGGAVLAARRTSVFLWTPVLWLIAAVAGVYEERTRLAPRFGEAHRRYRDATPLLLPAWGWAVWTILYAGTMILVLGG